MKFLKHIYSMFHRLATAHKRDGLMYKQTEKVQEVLTNVQSGKNFPCLYTQIVCLEVASERDLTILVCKSLSMCIWILC